MNAESSVPITRREVPREQMAHALEAAGIGTWCWDLESDRIEWDEGMMHLMRARGRAGPRCLSDIFGWFHPDDRARLEQAVTESIQRSGDFAIEVRTNPEHGPVRFVRGRGRVLTAGTTPTNRMLGAAWDATSEVHTECLLREKIEELERRNQELDEFAHTASHDLREPLRGIVNFATFLEEDYGERLEGDALRYLSTIVRLSQRLEVLLDALLDRSRAGRVELECDEVDLREVLDDALEAVRDVIDRERPEVIRQPLPRVVCDRRLIAIVLRNLIANALVFNTSEPKRIEIGCRSGSHPKVFFVSDNGIGIDPRHRDSVFRIFRRLHARDRFGGGPGVGLTVARLIVERHGGRIWIEPNPEGGSIVCFTLGKGAS